MFQFHRRRYGKCNSRRRRHRHRCSRHRLHQPYTMATPRLMNRIRPQKHIHTLKRYHLQAIISSSTAVKNSGIEPNTGRNIGGCTHSNSGTRGGTSSGQLYRSHSRSTGKADAARSVVRLRKGKEATANRHTGWTSHINSRSTRISSAPSRGQT